MTNFEIKDDDFNSYHKYVDITSSAYSLLVGAWDYQDDDGDGNIIQAVIDEDKMYESLKQSVQKWFNDKAVADATIEFPAQRWTDDSDDAVEYTAKMKLSDFELDASFDDKGYYGGLQLEITVYAPQDNEDFDNEDSMEPVCLLAAWKLQELLNADSEFWNNICSEAYDDSVTYEILEEETA